MAVRHEIKSQLAKLLATEDLIVEHRKVETASFNVQTRVLVLPQWERASSTVYDLLVGHEVGHALYTPDENWIKYKKIPPQFVNVVEDARIEKLMKRKYAGLSKTFYRGYKELNDEDFFAISDSDITTFNLADRANLYFKVGNFLDLSFTAQENEIIKMIDDCETFEDTLEAAEALYKYCKQQLEKPKTQPEVPQNDGNVDGDVEETEQGESEQKESETQMSDGDDGGVSDVDLEVQTADALEESIQDLVREYSSENVYVEIPKVDISKVIADNKEIHEYASDFFDKYDEVSYVFDSPDKEFVEFKRSAQKEVNYLVKEFECKKAADSYARASTARTGVLDTSNLHTYKFNEDLFKKVSVLPDGKNHGLIFVLDWSGSMQNVMLDTCKQLYNLLWFCKKVNIPFEVYGFTNEWKGRRDFDEYGRVIKCDQTPCYEEGEHMLHVDSDFSLMNFFTSKVSGKELEQQMKNIWRIAYAFSNRYSGQYSWPMRLSLSGTPLNESLVCLHQILPKFQRENKLQKVQCVVLTDGEACPLQYNKWMESKYYDAPFYAKRRIDPDRTILRDRKLGTTYKIEYRYNDFVDTMITNLKDNFPSVNFIGIRVLSPRDARSFMRLYKDTEKCQVDWLKTKSFCIKSSGYDAYFGISANALAQDSEFDVKDDATKAQIKSAFVKSLRVKKLNKKVLGEFISLVV